MSTNSETSSDAAFWSRAEQALSGLPSGNGLNIAHEAVDRHAVGAAGEVTAVRWIDRRHAVRDISYRQLAEATSRFANVLDDLGVQPGEGVFLLLGRVPELYVAVLGAPMSRRRSRRRRHHRRNGAGSGPARAVAAWAPPL